MELEGKAEFVDLSTAKCYGTEANVSSFDQQQEKNLYVLEAIRVLQPRI